MNEITIRQIDPSEHERSGSLAVQQATEALITSNDDRELAGTVVQQLNVEIAAIENEFNGTPDFPGPVTLAHKAWKAGVALRDKALASRLLAKQIWNKKILNFEYSVEQARLAEHRKAEEDARKKAQEERDRQIREAKQIGDREVVNHLKQTPLHVQAEPPKTPEVTKAAGLRRSAPRWDWRLADYDKIPCKWHMLNERAIDDLVKRLGPKCDIPGITVFDSRSQEE